ncbi:DNA helicase/exodeoxyribonuclease V subunit B [Fontibacillus phaseoli]|uniref:ATP-dependent helicase/deoxyribonuclease subunit B n=1 Tax=Fontibacillus phaseoli TaxID=1416533 RepID=A0A369BME7_9BACL|nr:helicase-exonuclease AddAB subunit AddB [Fontibacillus phaseoli]RCX22760.1 DNA helicase/exodeoxyribonuclease V subunit B [Fontibacillus phaseoli]
MSLQFIIGRSGSGKSSLVLEQITSKLKEDPLGPPMILLAPEQGTFQIEQALVSAPGLRGTVRVQVLGFRRLALRVMQETGGSALVPISEEGKKMLLYKILRRHKEDLKLYSHGSDQLGLIDELNALYTEMKKYNADFTRLDEQLQALEAVSGESPLLKDKLHDLNILYREFDAELARLYIDAEDHVVKLAEGAPDSSYLRGADLWIDGFHTFTPQEYKALGVLMQVASSVTVALTLDRPYDGGMAPHELNLFHPTAMTYIKLQELAESLGVEVKPNKLLDARPFRRFGNSETLSYLESAYERRTPWAGSLPPADLAGSLSLYAAGNRRIEVEGAAREMLRLAREQGARFRDMALFVRNLGDYEHIIRPVFEDYGIPVFMDQKASVLHHPLIEFIRGALDVALRYWKYEDVFRCVKSEFLLPLDGSLTRANMDLLENYALASGIQGYRWTDGRPWKGTPSLSLEGDEASRNRTDSERLQLLERCRAAVTVPLSGFEKRLKRANTVQDMCAAVYRLLEEIEAPQRLDLMAHRVLQGGQPQQAMEHRQLWNSILGLLDQIVEMMGEEKLSAELFAGILETGLKDLKLGLVPPAMDQVLVGSTDRTRTRHVKHAFLLGINEGVMPANLQEEGLLSDQERLRLDEIGLELAPGITRRLLDERFLIYGALSAASRSLWLSYPTADEDGKGLLPSEVIRHMKRIFPAGMLQEQQISEAPLVSDPLAYQLEFVSRPEPTLPRLIGQLRAWKSGQAISPLWWSVLGWYKEQPQWELRVDSLLGSLDYRNRVSGLTPATSRKLYGKRLRTSVSRMEKFSACPFSHFASHGLKLKERQLYRLKAPDIGQLFHAALSQMAVTFKEQNRSWGSLTPEECVREADAAVDKLAPKLQGEILLSTKRYGYISRKLKNIVGRASVILGEQSRRGSFEPVGLELDFGPGRPLSPLTFELPNGCVMEIVGRIDRVDMAEGEEGVLLRVIDYKSSQTDLKLHEVYYGLSLQMLTYLDVLLRSAESWLGQFALPAGTLYFHVHNPLLQSANGLGAEEARLELLKRFKMKGLLLADRDVIAKMDGELEKGYSEILPVAVKADGGFYSSASVATPEQWQTLLGSVRRTIVDIGTRITDGDVKIAPYRLGTETACTHCAYKPVCRFEEALDGSAYQVLNKPGKERLWELLERPEGKKDEPC